MNALLLFSYIIVMDICFQVSIFIDRSCNMTQLEILKEDLELATYDVKSFNYTEEKKSIPVVAEKIDLVADNYATVSGKRFFVMPNIFTRSHRKLRADEDRKFDLVLNYEYKDIDTAIITIPNGYSPEALPQDVKLESRFGVYTASVKLVGNKLHYHRSYEHYSGRFPAKEYPELVKFYESVYKADRNKVVLVKATN